ncbi:MAG: hypothetical protein N3F07_04085 [Candidatus Micrarchaeota archaeon]|nr:hypothetical protein [Candidatus Micrarchaeota archaeon]
MKFRMNPQRAYLLGLWKSRKTSQGVGVCGRQELAEAFVKVCLDEKLAEPDKMQYQEDSSGLRCFFYNTSLRSFLQKELENREDRLRYKNSFSACYFAGVFDAKGGWQESALGVKIPFLVCDRVDEIILLRLGFRAKREGQKLAVLSEDFYDWIAPYLKLDISRRND